MRDAVQALLNKREMEYTLQRGKGSFFVQVHSGHALVAAPALKQCSKVNVVKSHADFNHVKLVVNQPIRQNTATTTTSVAPKPSQVAADDLLVARVKQASHQEHALEKRHDDIQLKQALVASKRELEQQARHEQECLAAILEQSKRDEEMLHAQEQQRLEEVLRHSRLQEERITQLEQEKLEEILQLSQQDELERALSLSQLQIHHKDDDEQLNQALQQSLQDVHATNNELHRALSLSLQECPKDNHVELSISESTSIEMLQEQVGYVIEEVD